MLTLLSNVTRTTHNSCALRIHFGQRNMSFERSEKCIPVSFQSPLPSLPTLKPISTLYTNQKLNIYGASCVCPFLLFCFFFFLFFFYSLVSLGFFSIHCSNFVPFCLSKKSLAVRNKLRNPLS